jgi:hypothetical protein
MAITVTAIMGIPKNSIGTIIAHHDTYNYAATI